MPTRMYNHILKVFFYSGKTKSPLKMGLSLDLYYVSFDAATVLLDVVNISINQHWILYLPVYVFY